MHPSGKLLLDPPEVFGSGLDVPVSGDRRQLEETNI